MTLTQWNSAGRAYAQTYSAIVRDGGYTPGVYGPYDVLTWCRDAGWFGMFWQAGMSTAWSGGRNAQLWPGAHLRQRYSTTVGGVGCDVNDILQDNYGGAMATGDADKAFSEPYVTGYEPWVSGQSWMSKALEGPLRAANAKLDDLASKPPVDAAAVAAALTTEQLAAALVAAGVTPEAIAAEVASHIHVS
jgi:hypothetical protein